MSVNDSLPGVGDLFRKSDDSFLAADDLLRGMGGSFRGTDAPFPATGNSFSSTDDSFQAADELSFLSMDTASPYIIVYDGKDGGKTAHYMLRWVKSSGEKGPWSETISATITV